MPTRALAVLAWLLAACQGPPAHIDEDIPACEHQAAPASRFRLIAVGHKVTLAEAESAASYEAALRATANEHARPLLAQDRPSVLVFPESVGLSAVLLGPRGAAARQEPTAQAAFSALIAAHAEQVAFHARRVPEAGAGRLLLLAVTDPLWRAFDGTFSRLAREHGVYVAASVDVGDVEEVTDPAIADVLGDPDRPPGAPVYWVPDGKVYNQVIFYGPDGERIGALRKHHLTDLELVDLDLQGGLPEVLGPLDVGGLARVTAMISRDAWMQDALERQAARGASVLLQPEAFAGGWAVAPPGYPWPPDNLKRSGWAAVQKYPELRAAVAPMLVGNFFDVIFDGQSFAVLPGQPDQERRALLAQEPDTGWAAIAPWVADEAGPLDEQREALRLVGEALSPGGALDNAYLPGSVYVDIEIPADDGYPVVAAGAPDEAPLLGASVAIAPSGAGRQRHAAVAVLPDGRMVVAWEDTRLCTSNIFVATSDDGVSWTEPVRVRPWNQPQRAPALVATPGGELILAWQEVLGGDRAEVRVARSGDSGATWSRPVRVDPDETVEAWKPALAVDGITNDVYLAFIDRRAGGAGVSWRVHLARSSDGGQSFSAPVRVDGRERAPGDDPTYTSEWSPAVAARDDHVVIAYTHRHRPDAAEQPSNEVFVVESRDGGATFTAPRRLDTGGFPERLAADVAVDLGDDHRALVLWSGVRGARPDADVIASTGADPMVAPDASPGRDQWFPAVARLPDGARAVAWQDMRGGSNDIYVSRLSSDGFGPALRVDDAGGSAVQSWRPRVAARADGAVLVVWEDSRSGRAELRAAMGRPWP